MTLLVQRADVAGQIADVLLRESRVVAVGNDLPARHVDEVVDACGGALLPGLNDHHVHLLATAAAAGSVVCGPPEVVDEAGMRAALRRAATALPPDAWLRGIGYAESVLPDLDRWTLDRFVPDRPVRVQHRSGALWVLNSLGLRAAGLEDANEPDVERAPDGSLTGRLWRFDARLRKRLGPAEAPDLAAVSSELLRFGVTGATDATPDLDPDALRLLCQGVTSGAIQQELLLLGASGREVLPAGVKVGPRKLLLRDHDLPTYDVLVAEIVGSHHRGRPVAVHCVTREAMVLTLAAFEAAGVVTGDRIEHAAVVPPPLPRRLCELGIAVVTQPCFVALRGDDYLRDVHPDDLPHLYPYASLLASGVHVSPSSDAPFGSLDPWAAIRAAVSRRTIEGAVVGENERVAAAAVLDGYLAPLNDPGGSPRAVKVGARADLCLLEGPLEEVLHDPTAERVRAVIRNGSLVS